MQVTRTAVTDKTAPTVTVFDITNFNEAGTHADTMVKQFEETASSYNLQCIERSGEDSAYTLDTLEAFNFHINNHDVPGGFFWTSAGDDVRYYKEDPYVQWTYHADPADPSKRIPIPQDGLTAISAANSRQTVYMQALKNPEIQSNPDGSSSVIKFPRSLSTEEIDNGVSYSLGLNAIPQAILFGGVSTDFMLLTAAAKYDDVLKKWVGTIPFDPAYNTQLGKVLFVDLTSNPFAHQYNSDANAKAAGDLAQFIFDNQSLLMPGDMLPEWFKSKVTKESIHLYTGVSAEGTSQYSDESYELNILKL